MERISYLMSTNRRYEDYGSKIVEHLYSILDGQNVWYEIIIYSPFEPKRTKNVVWIREDEPGSGSVKGVNLGAMMSKGDYLFIGNDDTLPPIDMLKAVHFLESSEFQNRKYKVTCLAGVYNFDYSVSAMPTIGSETYPLNDKGTGRMKKHQMPEELKDPKFLLPEHKYAIFGYPVLRKETVQRHLCGHVLNPRFYNQFSDNWLPFFIGENGEYPLVCPSAPVVSLPNAATYTNRLKQDRRTFFTLAVDLLRGVNKYYV